MKVRLPDAPEELFKKLTGNTKHRGLGEKSPCVLLVLEGSFQPFSSKNKKCIQLTLNVIMPCKILEETEDFFIYINKKLQSQALCKPEQTAL